MLLAHSMALLTSVDLDVGAGDHGILVGYVSDRLRFGVTW